MKFSISLTDVAQGCQSGEKRRKENIAAFGGDPDRITVAGQSAGAWYTVMLTGHPEASKLFKRSLALSYPGSYTPLSKERAAELADVPIAAFLHKWSMVNGQWSMVNGQWSMVNGQWSAEIVIERLAGS